MTQATTTPSTLTTGIDLGDRKSHVCVLDADGQVIEESQIATKPKALRSRFEGQAPMRIALEAGTHSAWVSELLKEAGHDVLVANARKLRMIFQNDSKNDRLDAEQLARVARLDPKLLYPIEHRERSARADLAERLAGRLGHDAHAAGESHPRCAEVLRAARQEVRGTRFSPPGRG